MGVDLLIIIIIIIIYKLISMSKIKSIRNCVQETNKQDEIFTSGT